MSETVFSFKTSLEALRELGFFDVVLPFLLVFSIVYGILETIELFERKNINTTIAFSIGIIAAGSVLFTNILKSFVPFVGVILFFLLSFLVVIGLITGSKTDDLIKENWFRIPIILVSAGVLIFSFGVSQNLWGGVGGEELTGIFNSAFVPLIVISGFLIALVFIITQE